MGTGARVHIRVGRQRAHDHSFHLPARAYHFEGTWGQEVCLMELMTISEVARLQVIRAARDFVDGS
jgi:hypothetical protein